MDITKHPSIVIGSLVVAVFLAGWSVYQTVMNVGGVDPVSQRKKVDSLEIRFEKFKESTSEKLVNLTDHLNDEKEKAKTLESKLNSANSDINQTEKKVTELSRKYEQLLSNTNNDSIRKIVNSDLKKIAESIEKVKRDLKYGELVVKSSINSRSAQNATWAKSSDSARNASHADNATTANRAKLADSVSRIPRGRSGCVDVSIGAGGGAHREMCPAGKVVTGLVQTYQDGAWRNYITEITCCYPSG